MKKITRLWIGLGILALLTPLGLLASGTAWGEWGVDELSSVLGYVPQGMARFSEVWKAPLPDYTVPGLADTPSYILSAIVGMALVIGLAWGLGRLLSRREL